MGYRYKKTYFVHKKQERICPKYQLVITYQQLPQVCPQHCVILSERSESKDLRMTVTNAVISVRRSFDSGLRPALRMTCCFSDFLTIAAR